MIVIGPLIGLVLTVGIGALVWMAVSKATSSISSATSSLAENTSAKLGEAVKAHAESVTDNAEPLRLFEDPVPLRHILHTEFGKDVEVVRITVRSGGANVHVRPGQEVERYDVSAGGIRGRGGELPADGLFPLSAVDLEIIPELIADAQQAVGKPDDEPTKIVLQRGDDGVVGWEVYTYSHVYRYDVDGNRVGEPREIKVEIIEY